MLILTSIRLICARLFLIILVLPPHFIVVGNGSCELISLLCHLFLSVGDTIICCPPTYSLYTTSSTFCGASVLEVQRTTGYELDIESILAAIQPSTKLIILCSPNNPTGNLVSEDEVLALLETGRIVIVDEAYVEFSHHPRGIAHLVPMHRNLVVLRTFSKWAGLAGLRIGYGLCPEWIAQYIRRAQNPFEVNVLGHIAAIQTLKNLDYIQKNILRIIQEREHLFRLLAQQTFLDPNTSQGNFILAHINDELVKMEKLRATFESFGILLRYFKLPSSRDTIRITVGLHEHTERIAKALSTVEL